MKVGLVTDTSLVPLTVSELRNVFVPRCVILYFDPFVDLINGPMTMSVN